MKSKKGFALTDIPNIAIILVVVALILGIGVQMMTSMQGANSFTDVSTAFYQNSTFTALRSTAVDFTPSDLLYDGSGETHLVASSCASVHVYNASSNYADVTADFTVSGCAATQKASPTLTANNTAMQANFTYSYNVYHLNYNITRTGKASTEDFSDWSPTWATIAAAAVVLGMIAMYIMRPQ